MRPHPRRRGANVLAIAALLVTLLAAAVGCSGQSEPSSSPATTIPSGPTLVACTDSPYEPFESIVDGEPVGFDMDLLRLVGTALDRPTDVVVEPLDQFPARLADGTCEVAVSAIPIAPAGTTPLAFTSPYLDVDRALLTRADSPVGDWPDLEGRRVALVTGATASIGDVVPPGAVVSTYATAVEAVDALRADQVDAVVTDGPLADRAALLDPTLHVAARTPTDVRYGIATSPQAADLVAQLDQALAGLAADGSLAELRVRWFGR